ncbi:MAG TPA: lysylphosphatidylglycerol synthase transmembrane domain-containing protein [Candidatus Acidoferrales bacterium]|nr:lysylphosphatidylglycerol synthase transmembrane domain-containing protein [Candidatus Acidoferrales bacterium]
MSGSTRPKVRGTLRRLLFGAAVLVILGALVYRSRGIIRLEEFSWKRLGQSLRQARGSLLVLSLVTIYAGYAVRSLRWIRFSRYLGRLRFWGVYSSTVMGFCAIFLLGRAGEPIRPLLIARKERLPVSSMFGIYVLERLFDGLATAVVAGLGLLLLPRMAVSRTPSAALVGAMRTTGIVLLVLLFAAAVFLVYFRLHGAAAVERRLMGWRQASGWRPRAAGVLAGLTGGLLAIQSLGDLVAAISYSAVHWTLVATIYVWVAWSFGVADQQLGRMGFPGALLALAFTMVGSTLQLPGVGGGSQVASFLAYTGVFGVEKEPAAAASIALWLITFAASSLAGAPLLIREGWSMGELRQLARAEREAEAAGTHASGPEVSGGGGPAKPGEARR